MTHGTITIDQVLSSCLGQPVPTTTIYQDNKSTILLAENDRTSSSKRTHHINVWYFFVADNIKRLSQGDLLPHYKHAGRLIHEATTKQHIQEDAECHTELHDTDKANAEHRSVLETKKRVTKM